MRARCLFLLPVLFMLTSASWAQQWFSIQTDHLISYSDGSDRGAHDAARRGEQLIAAFGLIFHRKDITFATPLRLIESHDPELLSRIPPGSALVRTPAADYIIVDPSLPDSWTSASKAIATLTLEDNYPRAQPWFDSGMANYLAAAQFNDEQMELGAVPNGITKPSLDAWIPLGKLFELRDVSQLSPAQHAAFESESWALVHWLIEQGRLAQAGVYLNAVQFRGATMERALSDAFSMSSADFDREVRESLAKVSTQKMPAPRIEDGLFKSQKLSLADAHVLRTNLSLFGPDADRTLKELVAFMRQNQDNVAVHRALAWAFLLRNDRENAVEHIRRALALNDSDATIHYLYARWVNEGDENHIHITSAESRIGSELKAALKRDPNYAAALELLGLAQLNDGNAKTALTNLQRASVLRPRSDRYYLNLALAYQASGNMNAAKNLLLYARSGVDAAVSTEATESLSELGKQKKQQDQWKAMGLQADADANVKHSKYDNLQEAIAEDEMAEAKSKDQESAQDTRKIEYMKGRIIRVECDSSLGATIIVNHAGQTWQLHANDRNSIVLIGADHFDCSWRDTSVSINYKKSGTFRGDLISLEAN